MREERITIAKAIAIMLMVVAHAGLPSAPSHFISMFHMPLFFFVSGYCFKDKYLSDNKRFVINKVKGLYVPFVKWSFLFLVLHNLFFYLDIYNGEFGFRGVGEHLYTLKEHAFNALKILLSMTETEQLLGGYWFLKQLFVGSLLSLAIFRFVKNNFCGGGILLLLTIGLSYTNLEIPFLHIGALSTFAAFFMVMGRAYKLSNLRLGDWRYTVLFAAVVAFGSVYCGTSMLSYTTWQIVPYALCALAGTLMTLNISEWIGRRNNRLKTFLLLVGDHTLEVLTWHFLSFKLVSLLIISLYGLSMFRLACFPVVSEYSSFYWPLYSVVGIGLPLLIVYLRIKFTKQNLSPQ